MAGRLTRWATRLRNRFDSLAERVAPFGIVVIVGILTLGVIAAIRALTPKACRTLPVSIIDLELTFSFHRFDALLTKLGDCEGFVQTTFLTSDVVFPMTYSLALCAVYLWTERQRRCADRVTKPVMGAIYPFRNDIFVLMPIAAGAADIFLENIPLWLATALMRNNSGADLAGILVYIGSIGSAIKWSLICAAVLSIVAELLSLARGKVIRRLRFSTLALFFGALPLLLIPQGQDILQRLVEGRLPFVRIAGAAAAMTFAAFAVWYCGRKLVQLRYPGETQLPSSSWYEFFAEQIPRILGIALLILCGAAFAAVGGALPKFAVFAAVGFFVAVIPNKPWQRLLGRVGLLIIPGYWRIVSGLAESVGRAVVGLAIGSLFLLTSPHEPSDFWFLRIAAYTLLFIAWVFYIHVYSRRGRIAARESQKIAPTVEARLPNAPDKKPVDFATDVYPYYLLHVDAEAVSSTDARTLARGIRRGLITGLIVSALAVVVFTLWPVPVGRFLGALPILALATSSIVFYGSIATWMYERFHVRAVTIALVFIALFSLWNDSHVVETIGGDATAIARRPDIATRLNTWRPDSTAGSPSPIVLVAASGGGLRAAYWTAIALALIQDRDSTFNRHVFAISGVSGGSLGAALYAALVRDIASNPAAVTCFTSKSSSDQASPPRGRYSGCVHEVMGDDFLSPVLSKMAGPDFIQTLLPVPVRAFDRSLALEESWEDSYRKKTTRPTMSEGFLALYDARTTAGTVPALFLNATHVETGKRYIAESLVDSVRPAVTRPRSMHDSQDLLYLLGGDIKLSTAVHNSARFTYVSPPGRIQSGDTIEYGHVVDGGYFENSGLTTLREVLEVIRASRGPTGDRAELRPIVLYLCNDPIACREGTDAAPATKREAIIEWMGPLRALLATRDARGSLARADVSALRDVDFLQLNVCESLTAADTIANPTVPVRDSVKRQERGKERVTSPPLGWLLSKVAREWMDSSLSRAPASSRPSECRKKNVIALDSISVLMAPRKPSVTVP